MISLIDEAIKGFLITEASLSDVDISFEVPTKEWSGGLDVTTTNLYLFDIRENTELRKNQWEAVRNNNGTITQQRPPAKIDLFYIITAYSTSTQGNANILEHHLLSKILAVVHNHFFIPQSYLTVNFSDILPVPEIPLEVVHPKFLDEQGGFQLWSAIDQFLKPAIYIKVTVPIELQKEITTTAVLTKMMKYGQIVRKRSYELKIRPYTSASSFVQSDTISKVGLTNTAVYGVSEIRMDDENIKLNVATGLNQDNVLIIIDGKRTEFCRIDTISAETINLKEALSFEHPEGVELRRLDTDNPQILSELKFVETVPKGSDALMVAGKEMQNLKMGDIINVEDADRSEYFQITAISAQRSGIEINDTFMDIGGLVTNKVAAPIVGTNVILEAVLPDTSRKVIDKRSTDENGNFLFKDVVDGKYTIKADAEGYQEKVVDIDRISEAKMKKLIIRLEIT